MSGYRREARDKIIIIAEARDDRFVLTDCDSVVYVFPEDAKGVARVLDPDTYAELERLKKCLDLLEVSS